MLLDGDGLMLTGDGGWLDNGAGRGLVQRGAYAFQRTAQVVRRDGTLTRY